MRHLITPLLGSLTLLLTGCQRQLSENPVVSERYFHKYGYAVSKNEFEDRKYPGQVITTLKTGITITSAYENGILHGPTTHTFPHSQTVESYFLYNQGNLVKQIQYNIHGMPLREELQLSPNRFSTTKWYEDGTPMSMEEYEGSQLHEGSYLSQNNEVETRVVGGKGTRLVKDQKGHLEAQEEIYHGYTVKRESFYPNGAPESIAYYTDGVLNGEKKLFTESGEPLAIKEYLNGKLHGKTTFFKNGLRTVEMHYLDGVKNGLEIHYIDGGTPSQEITWENDHKHGPSRYYAGGLAQLEYFYDGKLVSENRWHELNKLDNMIQQINASNW
ncbi:Lipoprotein [Rhabdochlamydiaceae symbiont of Dictyostelium giganteum]